MYGISICGEKEWLEILNVLIYTIYISEDRQNFQFSEIKKWLRHITREYH